MTNSTIEQTIEETKDAFSNYFAMIDGVNFKQFYYDWHVDNMLAPFAELVEHFHRTYGTAGAERFAEFVDEITENVKDYNNDKPQLSLLKTSKYENDERLSSLVNGVEAFGFYFRQFVYNFADTEDHNREFGYWPIKLNMPYSCHYGLMIGRDILQFLKKNYSEITSSEDVYREVLQFADNYLRDNVTKTYQYGGKYNFSSRQSAMAHMRRLRDTLSVEAQNLPDNEALKDLFQVEEKGLPSVSGYRPCGFELEFYVPEEFGDYGRLIGYLKEKNGWSTLYSSNKDSSVYMDRNSAGVIMRDESLTRYNGLAAVEYASSVMHNRSEEANCLKIFDAFDEGHVNVHCSLHQHVSNEGFDLDTYKRLVKRMMRLEPEIISAFAAPERRDNNLLFATYMSLNLSQDGPKDYPFLCVMVDLCRDKKELQDMATFGNRYKTLNLMPSQTVEIRFMNATFNKRFVEAFLQFNREFVESAVANTPQHINRPLLNKFNWINNCRTDNKTVQHRLAYCNEARYDVFAPLNRGVSKDAIEGAQTFARLVMHALTVTKKLPCRNPSFNKKMREIVEHGRDDV